MPRLAVLPYLIGMCCTGDLDTFRNHLRTIVFDSDRVSRSLALYAAAIATNDPEALSLGVRRAQGEETDRAALQEVTLQSYLFLGFPRMLTAAECLHTVWPPDNPHLQHESVGPDSAGIWMERGEKLYRTVYGSVAEPLRRRVQSILPELFDWMILEGYGKVLSRPGVGLIDRELANVAMLLADNRAEQLHSHMRGALNVGAAPALLRSVIEDLRPFVNGHAVASELLVRMKVA